MSVTMNDFPKILCVDDNKLNQTMMKKALDKQGVTCDQAWNGEEAVNLVRKISETGRKYSIIFMDAEMRVKNGGEATSEIFAIDPDVVVIGQSSNPTEAKNIFAKVINNPNFYMLGKKFGSMSDLKALKSNYDHVMSIINSIKEVSV